MEKKETKKKVFKQVTSEALKNIVEKIVDQLTIQASSRDVVTEALKEFKTEYGIKSTIIKKVATVVFKRNKEEVEQENDELMELLEKVE